MDIEIVTVLKTPIKVVCLGGVTPSRLVKHPDDKPDELILIIPGNPGVTAFYEKFATRMFNVTKLPVWIISHGGHEKIPCPAMNSNPELYNLHGITRQKQEFIETYLKGVKLRCIGHSIGAKMILDLFNLSNCSEQIKMAYLLFPTIEQMAITREAQKIGVLFKYWPIVMFLSNIVKTLPQFFLTFVTWLWCWFNSADTENIPNIIAFFTQPKILRHVKYLAQDEFKTVLERNDDIIRRNVDKLRFYYSTIDHWTPSSFYNDLKEKIPNAKVEVCTTGISHSFVLNDSIAVADIVSNWIKVDREL